MKDYIINNFEWKDVMKLLDLATDLGLAVDCFEGSLLDNYIIYSDKKIKINKARPRKYILIREYYINAWSSGIQLIMTDDDNKANEFIQMFDDVEVYAKG